MLTADRTSKATLRRSVRLFRLFLREQSDPAGFYSAFADDSVAALGQFVSLADETVLDVGGGPGYFARSFRAHGARYIGVELDIAGDMPAETFAVRGSGTSLPFRTGSVGVAYCSNVLEHVAQPWRVADELVRVTRPGGTVFVSFTLWLSPWGGHETAPWHYLGGMYARQRYRRRHEHEPKNRFGESLFAHRASDAVAWARDCTQADLVAAYPRYHPRGLRWVAAVPGLREVLTWNLALVLRRR
ncbi:MAG TPA: class I SAM-dependent methyltransferase [Jatrophihabitantaceae bacterium]|nr:class I SAM-dependent methyltransferase [Jatrophihabitantaceae bacterium]